MIETQQYKERVATVVGGRGQLGSRVAKGLKEIGLGEVKICEQDDPFRDFVRVSTDLFFAVDGKTVRDMLQSTRDLLRPDQTILDGASVKTPLITLYRELDGLEISVCSTHLGAVPTHPWRGIKVWVCEVGPNSERAKRLAVDLFLSKNVSIQQIDIKDHEKVEQDQWLTFAVMHLFARALKEGTLKLREFDTFAPLNAELITLPLGRTLGQGVVIPSEILSTQPRKQEFLEQLKGALEKLEQSLGDRRRLKEFLQENIDFHDQPPGIVGSTFKKAGLVGSRHANLRMYSFSFRITDDRPGRLRELLASFHQEGINLTAIDSMPGNITLEEEAQGIDPDKIVDFDIGIDPKTIDPKKEARIIENLTAMGCRVEKR